MYLKFQVPYRYSSTAAGGPDRHAEGKVGVTIFRAGLLQELVAYFHCVQWDSSSEHPKHTLRLIYNG